jgi:Leucine-rich repeat (LRR) protein
MLLFMQSVTLYAQGSREQDSLALVKLYNSTTGASWINHTNWLTGNPINTWYGITVTDGRVTNIDLRINGTQPNNLQGMLPAAIGDLLVLEELNLNEPGLSGTIPAELYNLTNLKNLNIQNAQIGGTISTDVSKLVNLEIFQIAGCRLEGSIPIELCSLTNLTGLSLNRNQMSGEIPSEIGDLINLEWLIIYRNQFTGTLPSTIGNLSKLKSLNCYNCGLSGDLPPEIGNLAALTDLNLSVNQFSGYVPLENLTSIKSIYINNNNFTDIPDLSGFTAISHFKVNNNRFTFEDIEPNIGLSDFIYAPQDSVGAVKDTTIETKQDLTLTINVGGSANQYQWFKDGNSISVKSDSPLHIVADLTMEDAGSYTCKITNTIAQNLILYSRPLNVTIVPSARDRDSLALVDFYNSTDGANWTNKFNWLTDKPIDTWNGISVSEGRVSGIFLYDNNLSGTISASLENLSELKILNIYGNALTGTIPVELMSLSNLTVLLLSDNSLSGVVPSEIGNLTELTNLALSRNSLSGSIPSTIGALTKLKNLNLSYNNFTGIIPASISHLTVLESLSLSYNDLSGSIPSGIGDLTNLESLRLSSNSLSGEIPTSIKNLTLLDYLDLSDNDLSGYVPAGLGQLNNLTNVRIHYNNLHGLPDMSAISGLTELSIQHNNFDFGDIEPNINVSGFIYAPQDSIGELVDTLVTAGNELILSVDAGGSATAYQWMKNGSDIAGATDKNYVISAFSAKDAGVYACRMNNTIVTQLTLFSREFIVQEYILRLDIADVQFVDNPEQNDSSSYVDQKVKLQGLVMTNPRDIYLGTRWGAFITDPDDPLAAWSSIIIIQNDTINTVTGFQNVRKGDIVSFTGTIIEYSGLTELVLDNNSADAAVIISNNNSLPSPKVITLADLIKSTTVESWESTLLKINSVTVKDTANSSQMLPIRDDAGNNCYLDDYFLWFRQNIANGSYEWPVKDTELSATGFFRQLNDIYGDRWYTINPRNINDIQITTEEDPIVTTYNVESSAIGIDGASVYGDIQTKNLAVIETYFEYGRTESFGDTVHANPFTVAKNTLEYHQASINGLNSNTLYYVRLAVKTEDFRIITGETKSFTTLDAGNAPIANALEANDIMPRNAFIRAEVDPRGVQTTVLFVYGTDPSLTTTIGSLNAQQSPIIGSSPLICTAVLSGLQPSTTYYYRAEANNMYGSSESQIVSFRTEEYVETITLSNTISFEDKEKDAYVAADFRLFGIPGNSLTALNDLLDGTAGEDWISYWDTGANTDFLIKYDGSNIFQCSAGKGFWILNKGALKINKIIPNIELNDHSEAEIPVHQGWNIITNPFNNSISWNDVKNAKSNEGISTLGDLWQFDGTFSISTVMVPYKAYYVYTTATKINIPYLPQDLKKTAAFSEKKTNEGWTINILLSSGKYTDNSTMLGMRPEAESGYDDFDIPKPHAVGDIINVCFERPDWETENNTFACDIRPPFDEMEKWEFTVNAAKGETAEISFKGIENIPAEYGVFLIDAMRSKYHDLRQDGIYYYTPSLKAEPFSLIIGREDALQDELDSIVPLEFKVENNFPNPFNPETTIPLQLPKEDEISVTIYNILGEKITTLHQGKLPAGRHLFTWRAGNIPSGIYFYRISSEQQGKSLTGKMILMK